MDWLNILSLFVGGTGLASLIISLLTLPLTQKKRRAEIAKLVADIDDKRIETLGKMQDELYEAIERNKQLFVSKEKEHEANEKLRNELNRLHDGEVLLHSELNTARSESLYLRSDLALMNSALLKKQSETDILFERIRDLGAIVSKQKNDILKLQKVTGKLELGNNK